MVVALGYVHSSNYLCHIPLQIGAFHSFGLRVLLDLNLLLAELLRATANLLLIHAG